MFIRHNLFTRLFWFLIPLVSLSLDDLSTTPPPPPPAPTPDANAGIQALIARHNNDLMRVIDHLYGDNFGLREKNRELKAKNQELEGKVPGQGAVVLSADEAKLLETYKALGELELLKTALNERDQVKGELGVLRRDGILRDVAEAGGFKFGVLRTLSGNTALNGGDLEFEIREVEDGGQKKRVPYVKNGTGEAKPLADYAKTAWADFLPALSQQPQQSAGTPYPAQNAGSPPPQANVLTNFKKESQEARAAAPNPLKSGAGNK